MADSRSRMDTARIEELEFDTYEKLCKAILSDDVQEALDLSSHMQSMAIQRQHIIYWLVFRTRNAELLEIFSREGFRRSNNLQITWETFYNMAVQFVLQGRYDLAEIIVSNVKLNPHPTQDHHLPKHASSLLNVAYNAKDRSDELVDLVLLENLPPCRPHSTSQNHLHIAVIRNHYEAAAKLIARGQIMNELDDDGSTPLHLAVTRKHDPMLYTLLDAGASVTDSNSRQETPLHLAWQRDGYDAMDTLLFHQVQWPGNPCSRQGVTHLHIACANNHLDALKALLLQPEVRPDVNKPDCHGRTPLHYAVEGESYEAVEYLLSYGGPGPCEPHLSSACSLAKDLGIDEMVGVLEEYADKLRSGNLQLLSSPVWLGQELIRGNNELHVAVYQLNASQVDYHMEHSAASFIVELSHENLTALHIAFIKYVRGYAAWEAIMHKIIAGLAKRNITNNVEGQGGLSYVHILCAVNSKDSVALVEKMAMEDSMALCIRVGREAQLFPAYTALHMALEFGRLEMAYHLLSSEYKISFSKNEQGQTPLDMILSQLCRFDLPSHSRPAYQRLVKLILERLEEYEIRHVETYNFTLLHMAVFERNLNAVKDRLEVCPDEINIAIDRNCRYYSRCTPLHLAVRERQYEIAELLINHGADVDARGIYSNTPMHMVAYMAKQPKKGERLSEVIPRWMKLFLDAGADVNLTNAYNETVLGLSCKYLWRDNIEGNEARISFPSLDDGYDFNLLRIINDSRESPFSDILNDENPSVKEMRANICKYILAYSKIGIEHHAKTRLFYNQALLRDNILHEHNTALKVAAEREAKKMKDIRLNPSSMTLADVITAHPNELSFLAGNGVFQMIVRSKNFEAEYPIFHGHLRTRNRHAKIRAILVERFVSMVRWMTSLPLVICLQISSYMSMRELFKLRLGTVNEFANV